MQHDAMDICPDKDTLTLKYPLLWNKKKALDICAKLDNGRILDFPNSFELYSISSSECKYFWTPFWYRNQS